MPFFCISNVKKRLHPIFSRGMEVYVIPPWFGMCASVIWSLEKWEFISIPKSAFIYTRYILSVKIRDWVRWKIRSNSESGKGCQKNLVKVNWQKTNKEETRWKKVTKYSQNEVQRRTNKRLNKKCTGIQKLKKMHKNWPKVNLEKKDYKVT